MKKQDISPELKKMLESLQEVPERGLQDSHAGREAYLARVRKLNPRRAPKRASTRTGRGLPRRSWAARLAIIGLVLVIALSGLGGTVYAAQAAQPDDLLYGVKTLTEEIQVSLESDPEDKLDLYVSFANRRLQEIQAQVAAGEEVSQKALDLLEKHTQKMLEQAAKLEGQGMENALRQIETNLQQQNQMMAEAGKEHPQGGPPGLLKAQEKIRERLELVENGINEPQGFKDEIRQRKENSDSPGNGKGQENDNSNKPDSPPGQENKDNPGNGNGNGQNNQPGLTGTPDPNGFGGQD
jgi:hypothetical protein